MSAEQYADDSYQFDEEQDATGQSQQPTLAQRFLNMFRQRRAKRKVKNAIKDAKYNRNVGYNPGIAQFAYPYGYNFTPQTISSSPLTQTGSLPFVPSLTSSAFPYLPATLNNTMAKTAGGISLSNSTSINDASKPSIGVNQIGSEELQKNIGTYNNNLITPNLMPALPQNTYNNMSYNQPSHSLQFESSLTNSQPFQTNVSKPFSVANDLYPLSNFRSRPLPPTPLAKEDFGRTQAKISFPMNPEFKQKPDRSSETFYIEEANSPSGPIYSYDESKNDVGFTQKVLAPPVRVWRAKARDNSPFMVIIDVKFTFEDSIITSKQQIKCGRSFFNDSKVSKLVKLVVKAYEGIVAENYQLITEDNIIMNWNKRVGDYLIRNGSVLRLRKRKHQGIVNKSKKESNAKSKRNSVNAKSTPYSSDSSDSNKRTNNDNIMY